MVQPQTEMRHPEADGLDQRPAQDVLRVLAEGQVRAAESVRLAISEIAEGAKVAADCLRRGGRLIYVAAGSSGLMALADALELPGTYGIDKQRIIVLFAGGTAALSDLLGAPEDDADQARREVEALSPQPHDCFIALTASGRTPYPLAAVDVAQAAGAQTIGLANNAGAPLLKRVDIPICLPTPPEVIAGSTRMGAGTAQKIALNMLSTLMGIELGHVHDGYMVNVFADNLKLRERARGIVAAIAGVDQVAAGAALQASGGAVKPAILIAAGAIGLQEAEALLARNDGRIRASLASLRL